MTATAPMKAKKRQYSVLVIDDHPVVTFGVKESLASVDDLTVVGEASGQADALRAIKQYKPDLILIDITLEKDSGLNVMKTISSEHPDVRILVFSMHDEFLYAERAMRAGAHGYVHKGTSPKQLVAAIKHALSGQTVVSEKMTDRLVQKALGNSASETGVDALSDRELEIFQLIGQGVNLRNIAESLGISIKTVESHRENIKKKLNLESANQLTRFAVAWVENPS